MPSIRFARGNTDLVSNRSGSARAAVTAAVHEIAGGSSLVEFGATLREIPSDDIPASALTEFLDHVSLGRDPAEG